MSFFQVLPVEPAGSLVRYCLQEFQLRPRRLRRRRRCRQCLADCGGRQAEGLQKGRAGWFTLEARVKKAPSPSQKLS